MENKIKVIVYVCNINGKKSDSLIKHFESCCKKALQSLLEDVEIVSNPKEADTCFHATPTFLGVLSEDEAEKPVDQAALEESLKMMNTYKLSYSFSLMFKDTNDPDIRASNRKNGISHPNDLDVIDYWKNLMEDFNSSILEPIRQNLNKPGQQ